MTAAISTCEALKTRPRLEPNLWLPRGRHLERLL